VRQAQSYKSYGVFWDGRNANGRFVGGGGYLMVLSMTDVDGKEITQRMKIGVRR